MVWQISLLISLALFLTSTISAQTFSTIHYGPENGLPTAPVYDLLIAQDGLLWLATGEGIYSFNGNRCVAYHHDLAENPIGTTIRITEDEQTSTIWAGTHKNGLFMQQDSGFTAIGGVASTSRGLVHTADQVYVLGTDLNILPAQPTNGFPELERITLSSPGLQLAPLPQSSPLLLTTISVFQIIKNQLHLLVNVLDGEFSSLWVESETHFFTGSTAQINEWKNGILINEFSPGPYQPTHLLKDKYGRWWFSHEFKGLYSWKDGELINIGKQLHLEHVQISQICEGTNGSIWVATKNKGLFQIKATHTTHHNTLTGFNGGAINFIKPYQANEFIIGSEHQLDVYKHQHLTPKKLEDWHYFKDVLVTSDQSLIVAAHHEVDHFVPSLPKLHREGIFPLQIYALCAIDTQEILGSYYADQLVFYNHSGQQIQQLSVKEFGTALIHRTRKLLLHEGAIWQCTSKGMRLLNTKGEIIQQWMKPAPLDIPKEEAPFYAPIQDLLWQDSTGWLATNEGVFQIEQQGTWKAKPLPVNITSPTCLAHGQDSAIWIGTAHGLWRWHLTEPLRYFSTSSGLQNDYITALYLDTTTHQLLIGSRAGLSLMDIDLALNKEVPLPVLSLRSMKNKHGLFNPKSTVPFELLPNDFLSLTLDVRYFGQFNDLVFKYLLDGLPVGSPNSNTLILNGLKGGAHDLQVQVKAAHGNWSAPLQWSFSVAIPWYQKRWIWVLIASTILIVTLLLVWRYQYQRHQEVLKKHQIRKRINQLQLQSLHAMMRPHFIANLVTAVRHALRHNDRLVADQAMANLGQLMRTNLQMIQQEYITLQEEKERLTHYIELERFSRRVDWNYRLVWPEDLLAEDFLIPPMLLQPFVENAILYGLTSKHAWLEIAFTRKEYSWHINITDNGPGMEKASQHTNHVSNGIRITQERLAILTELTGELHKLTICNGRLTGQDFGCRVTISLPVIEADTKQLQ